MDNKNSVEINEDDPNIQVVNLTKKSQPRTKHDIIGSSDDEDEVDEQSSGEDNENGGDSDAMFRGVVTTFISQLRLSFTRSAIAGIKS